MLSAASCTSLQFVRLSRNIEFIGSAFSSCYALKSIFIPPSCIEIDRHAFTGCTKLIIFSVSQNTQIGRDVFRGCTELLKACPFCEEDHYYNSEYVNEWIKNINVRPNDKYLLLRECSSFKPRAENICAIVKSVGIQAFREKNLIGVTPAQYLEANNFTQIDQTKIINRYILDLMGETV